MIEQIKPNIYKVEIPLPNNPLKSLNSYIIKSDDRNLIIDTGMNRPECMEVMLASLEELDIDLYKTDLFITHMHSDHSGNISNLAKENAKVYCHKKDAEIIGGNYAWEGLLANAILNGFPAHEDAIGKHPGFKYRDLGWQDFTYVNDGDVITIGDYSLTCVHTPGHSEGHMCLYEKNHKILFSGDHILYTITPNISIWIEDYDALADYLLNLDKVGKLDVELVLPAHRNTFTDLNGRIEELKQHHEKRLQEILDILATGARNTYEVAAQMKWDLKYDDFENLPTPQKWFAMGEALAHLTYLQAKQQIKIEQQPDKIRYSLV
ncbi:MAG: MBL fold metallo-hydrolase [Syntrophomonadaceae bacterium]|nr:MBL fold metallo-hydrolase [Syntrophomonadaceae bacterium]